MLNLPEIKSLKQLITVFNDDKACHQFLAAHRWVDGIISCPKCAHESAYVFKDGIRYKCKGCKKIFTAKTGLIMDNSKLSLQDWFIAIWLMLSKKGISSVQMSKELNITQKTAWHMMHKIRKAMGNVAPAQLSGTVEIDEAFVGGKDRFKHKKKKKKHNPGRGWIDKTPVLGMIERGGKVKAMVVPDVLMVTIYKQALINIRGGSNVMGDGFLGYRALERVYDVKCIDHSKGWYVDGEVHTNTIEGFWSQMKRCFNATYHKVTRPYLNNYIQECVFRYNNRTFELKEQLVIVLCQARITSSPKMAA